MEEIRKELLWRLYAVFIVIFLVGMMIFLRAVQVQVIEGEHWLAKSDSLHVKYKDVKAERGNILSDDGSLLATSISLFDIHFDAGAPGMTDDDFNQNVDSLSYYLANYINNSMTEGQWKEYLVNGRYGPNDGVKHDPVRYLLIKKGVNYDLRQYIQTLPLFRNRRNEGGLIVEAQMKREHPFQMLAHRTIGYIRENAESVGLESSFDEILRGAEGKQLMQRVSGDVWIPVNDITEVAPRNGKDIQTTLDINLQDITEIALERGVKARDADHGCAIVMEVKTGAIKAIANIGRTDALDEKGAVKWWENYNYAVGESTEPGSTFKLATLLMLLEDGYIKLSDTIDVNLGKTKYYDEEMEDAEAHGLKKTTIQHAFEISSNVGVSQLAHKYYNIKDNGDVNTAGRKRFIEKLKGLHLTEKTGVDVEGEAAPYIKNVTDKLWAGTTIPWMSIGYETHLTPLQVLTFYNAVANNGRMMKPYLVKEIQNYGETEETIRPQALKNSICSSSTIQKLKELLIGVVKNGTARNINNGNVPMAGKTGTCILNFNSKNRGAKKYQTSFCGFFPADDPQYSCIVVMNNPRNNWYGAVSAAPVAKEIAEKSVAVRLEAQVPLNFGKKPNYSTLTMPNGSAGEKTELKRVYGFINMPYFDKTGGNKFAGSVVKNDSLALMYRPLQSGLVPNVTGMGLRDALYLLENSGVKVRFTGVGKVRSQSIKPGTKAAGQVCLIDLD